MPYPHAFIKLTDKESALVSFWIKRYLVTKQYKKRRRLQILYLSDQGFPFDRIARRLDYHYNAVRWNIYLYQKEGLKPFIPG